MSNPLSVLTDAELYDTQLMLALACGRAHGTFRNIRKQYYCGLAEVLKVEADNRGRPSPVAPYHMPTKKDLEA